MYGLFPSAPIHEYAAHELCNRLQDWGGVVVARSKVLDGLLGDVSGIDPTEQERRFARRIGGRRHPGSGASMYCKGDGSSGTGASYDGFLFDSKQTAHSSFRMTAKDLAKLTREAMAVEKHPALQVMIKGEADPIMERTWVAVPERVFLALVRGELDLADGA